MENCENNENNTTGKSNYQLNSEAVDALVNADTEQAPQYSEEELSKYRSRKKIHIPEPVKILFIKAWFGGAVCYFILWGLALSNMPLLDQVFILGVVLGMVTDLLTNNILRFMEKTPGESDKWLLVTHKGIVGFGANMLLSIAIIVCVVISYQLINLVVVSVSGDPNGRVVGVGPIVFGLLCMGYDMLFIGIKRLFQSILRDAKDKARDLGA